MRSAIVAAVAALLLMPAATESRAAGTATLDQAQPTDISAAKKKKAKMASKKRKAPKVEYMRAVPSR